MIIEGYITIDGCWDSTPRINKIPINEYLEDLIPNERQHKGIDKGYVKHKDKGLGEKHYFLADCKMRAYYSSKECSLSEAQNSVVSYLCGDIKGYGCYTGYSEWTILGFDIESLTIGGHDLRKELASHSGEYIHLLINEP